MRTELNTFEQRGPSRDFRSKISALIAQHSVLVFALITLLLGLCVPAEGQQRAKIPRIGYVSGTGNASNQEPYVEALRQELRDFGYTEGKNFAIEFRGAEGKVETFPSIVAELIQLKV